MNYSERKQAGHILARYTANLWLMLIVLLSFTLCFVIYIRAENQINQAHETRLRSVLLAAELRNSSDDLTRMVRTYVVTGNPIYKQHFQEIIEIRDGLRPRPVDYQNVYWDLVLTDDKRPSQSGVPRSLISLMEQAGFTDDEIELLKRAKVRSDDLTQTEFTAMQLIERDQRVKEPDRLKAIRMLHDQNYHHAKLEIMEPIRQFRNMVEKRTIDSVELAENWADNIRLLLIFLGILQIVLLWRAKGLFSSILGTSLQNLYRQIAELGKGDHAKQISVATNHEESIAGWLSNLQTRLAKSESDKQQALITFETFFEQPIDIHLIADLDGVMRKVNHGWLHMLGYKKDELEGLNFLNLVHPDDIDRTLQEMEKLAQGVTTFHFENRYRHKNGEYHVLTWSAAASIEEKLIYAVATDITERVHIENELRHLRSYLSNIIDSMASVIIGVDSDLKITKWNSEAQKITGMTADIATGRPVGEAFPRLGKNIDIINKAIQTNKKQSQLKCHYQSEGQTRYEDINVYPLDHDGMAGAVIRIDDVTDKVRIEEMMIQNEKILSVGGLAAGMAHEINNPLAGIMQNLEVVNQRLLNVSIQANKQAAEKAGINLASLQEYIEDRNVDKCLEHMHDAGKRATDIVSSMLDFARKSDSINPAVDLRELLDKSVELASADYDLKKHYDFRSIEIERDYASNLPLISCEEGKIQQVLLNILYNGAQAMHTASTAHPKFILRAGYDVDEDKVRVEIEDNGEGMDEAIRRRIFEPFFTTKKEGVGTGLGLSVSYFIVTENHGGELTVDSEPGRGSRFSIRLPVNYQR